MKGKLYIVIYIFIHEIFLIIFSLMHNSINRLHELTQKNEENYIKIIIYIIIWNILIKI